MKEGTDGRRFLPATRAGEQLAHRQRPAVFPAQGLRMTFTRRMSRPHRRRGGTSLARPFPVAGEGVEPLTRRWIMSPVQHHYCVPRVDAKILALAAFATVHLVPAVRATPSRRDGVEAFSAVLAFQHASEPSVLLVRPVGLEPTRI